MTLQRTFYVPSRFHPFYSLLGRGMRRLAGDERQAEAFYLVAVTGVVLVVLLAQYLAWAFLQPALESASGSTQRLVFWGCQVVAFLLAGLTCALGFKPAVVVTATPDRLHIRQGKHQLVLFYDDVLSIRPLSPLLFHRHYARFSSTRVFVGRIGTDDLLLIATLHGPVVLSLTPSDQATLCRLVESQPVRRIETVPRPA